MVTVKFLKDFMEHKKGSTAKVSKERADYWGLVGVAKRETAKSDSKEAPAKTTAPAKEAAPKKAATKTAAKKSTTKKGKK